MEQDMKLTFIYAPVTDLAEALTFYRDTLGWSEAWREGDSTVAFQLPDSAVQVMVDVDADQPPGPMYLVDNVAAFLAGKPSLKVTMPPYEIPDGVVAAVQDPAGNTLYVFDQARG
jgi:predicted enzyme related to lactoylglutathione lyase